MENLTSKYIHKLELISIYRTLHPKKYAFHTHTECLQAFRYQAQMKPQQILKNEYYRDNPLTTML